MRTDPSELARLDRIATTRVLATLFRQAHPEYFTPDVAPPPPMRGVSPADCEAVDDTFEAVRA